MSYEEAGRLGALAAKKAGVPEKKHQEYLSKYNKNPKMCEECGVKIPYEIRFNRFCSHSCSATNNNKKRILKRERTTKICVSCGTTIICKPCEVKTRKYCSIECQKTYEWNILKLKIEAGSKVNPQRIKAYLIEKRGNKCEMCTLTEWLGKPILVIMDHIDGDSTNNKLGNLRLICSNCDATLPTYKSKNKNSTRQYRRKRYAEGKSY